MWTDLLPQTDRFKNQLQAAIKKLSGAGRVLKIPQNRFMYVSGENDQAVYLIESGRVKLSVPVPDGKECLIAIRTAGEIVGELALAGQTSRDETAVAMKDTLVLQVQCTILLAQLKRENLLESLAQYLTIRIAEQQLLITSLSTMDSEHRLAEVLLHLSRIIGRNQSCGTCISQKISQTELAKMVGTTRTRIGFF
jgi:CRP/FNR family transcriptional regulator, cyclic AMP receptor protein